MSENVDVFIVHRRTLYEVNAGAPLLELVRVKGTRTKKQVRIPRVAAWRFNALHHSEGLSYSADEAFDRFELIAWQRIKAAHHEIESTNADLEALASLRQLQVAPTEEDR